jgi:hypothetical protein
MDEQDRWHLLELFENKSNGLFKVRRDESYEENSGRAFWIANDNKQLELKPLHEEIRKREDPNVEISWGVRHG